MIPTLGLIELLIILVVALLVLGPQQLVGVAQQLGRATKAVHKAWQDLKKDTGL